MEESDNSYLFVVAWWVLYALVSFMFTCFFKKFFVIPILEKRGATKNIVWRESLIWGFWISWQYIAALVFLVGYQCVFRLIRLVARYDAASSKFWNEKERAFFHSTPKSLLCEWVMQHFAEYYPEWKPRA